MWLILQAEKPDDYVCSTGVSHTVKELCDFCFSKLGLDFRDYVVSVDRYLRPEELNHLKGDSSKLRNSLGWEPKYTFESMLDEMVDHWINLYKNV
jgi:GDPmannose 4,6-dehydratase